MKKIAIFILKMIIPVLITIIGTQLIDKSIPMRFKIITSDQQYNERFETTGFIVQKVLIENKKNIPLENILIESTNNIKEIYSSNPYFKIQNNEYYIELLPVNSEIIISIRSTKENIKNDLKITSAYGVAKGKVNINFTDLYQLIILFVFPVFLIIFTKQKEKLLINIKNKNNEIEDVKEKIESIKIFEESIVVKLGEKRNLSINNKTIPLTIKSITSEEDNPVVELKIDSNDIFIDPGSKYEYVKFQYYKYKERTFPTWDSKIVIMENRSATDDYFILQIDIDHINEVDNLVHMNVSSLEFINEGKICLTKT